MAMRYLIFTMVLLLASGNPIFAQDEPQAPVLSMDNVTIAQEKPQAPAPAVPAEPEPVMEIKQLAADKPLYSFELRDVEIGDLFRLLAHDYKLNLLVDKDVSGQVTASLTEVSLEEALQTIAQAQNLKLEKKGNILWVVPHLITKIFILKYIEAKDILGLGESSESTTTSASATGPTAETTTAAAQTTGTASSSTTAASGPSSIYDLLSEKGKVFLGKQPNSLLVIDYPPHLEKIEAYFKEIDQRMANRVFKLKYLKAADVVGKPSTTTASSTTLSSSGE